MTEAIEAQVASLMARQGFREAAQLLERTLESCPTWTVGWLNLGLCRLRLRQGDPAALALEKGLELEPCRPRVRLSLADAAILRGQPDQAIDWCQEECRQFPKEPPSWIALGMALERLDCPEAGEAYREGLRLSPNDPEIAAHLGRWLHHQHDLDSAKSLLDPLHRHHPHQGRLQWQWAVNCFLRGDVTRGLHHLDSRWAAPEFPRDRSLEALPLWNGDSAVREPILVEPEQGYGDTLQFVRFVPELVRRGHRVWLGLPRPLHRLVGNSMTVERILSRSDEAMGAGCRIPVMSLPSRLGVRGEDLDGAPYLRFTGAFDPQNAAHDRPLTVGLVWRGNPVHANDRRRSLSLGILYPLLGIPGVDWVSLQWGDAGRLELDQARADGFSIRTPPSGITDFQDTAEQVCRTDLILTVDTALCHLAGAIGHPVWTLLPYNPDWRWALQGDRSVWYGSMRLYRQTRLDSWAEPLERVREALLGHHRHGRE